MPRILMMEGNPLARQEEARAMGIRSASDVYIEAIRSHCPDIGVAVIHAADRGQTLPAGTGMGDYDGLVISGSALRAFDDTFEVRNQIELLTTFAQTGLPVLGSCWGLQVAAIAGGGTVGPSPNGREFGIARKITVSAAGRDHAFLAGRAASFDAPCIHYDEVTQLPSGASILCSNAHSEVQGAVIPVGRSQVWAVQYHPEFDLGQLSMLTGLYAQELVDQGFFLSDRDLRQFRTKLDGLADDPANRALAWQLGVDQDILDDKRRCTEIINWLDHQILGRDTRARQLAQARTRVPDGSG